MYSYRLFIPLVIALALYSCKKDQFITSKDAVVRLSSDTLFFDTVFVSTGSVTQSVKIVNGNDRKLRLSEVKLMGGTQSFFSLNIDGTAVSSRNDIELEAGDSLYVFVAVTIPSGATNLPFIVGDSIRVSFNGVSKFIQLQAWGQNAHFLRDEVIEGNVIWDNTLPYVILGGLRVDTTAHLTISPGCRIYVHADAPLLVDGSLEVLGGQDSADRVRFLSDRLDDPYRDLPGSWPGIYFRQTSSQNRLQYAIIKNSYQAVVTEGAAAGGQPQVVMEQCIIDNSYDAGILGAGGSLQATNCLITNCGKNIMLGYGGEYAFMHCTAASYSNDLITHMQPVLSVSNYVVQGGSTLTNDLSADFVNCIFWGNNGNVDNEVQVSKQGATAFHVGFMNCDWKVRTAPTDVTVSNMMTNVDPEFDSVNNSRRIYNFRLKAGSPVLDKGVASGVSVDLDGKPRPVGLPDPGCYERQ